MRCQADLKADQAEVILAHYKGRRLPAFLTLLSMGRGAGNCCSAAQPSAVGPAPQPAPQPVSAPKSGNMVKIAVIVSAGEGIGMGEARLQRRWV